MWFTDSIIRSNNLMHGIVGFFHVKQIVHLSLAIALLLFLGAKSFGQVSNSNIALPDLRGEWRLDASRSELSELAGELVKSVKSYGLWISIEQKGVAYTIKESGYYDTSYLKEPFPPEAIKVETYYADGRGESAPIDTKVSRHQAVAKVVDGKLVILLFSLDDHNKKIQVGSLEYSLADGGNTLIRRARAFSANHSSPGEKPKSPLDSTMIFTRSNK